MSDRRQVLGRIFDAAALTVAAFGGTYVFVYLYRWEWQRAIVSGVFVLVAEVALFGVWALRKLNRLETRIDELANRSGSPGAGAATDLAHLHDAPTTPVVAGERHDPAGVRERIRSTRPGQRHRFEWLDPRRQDSQLGVFVPVLMGAGIVLSVLAWAVERIAGFTTVPALERSLAGRLAGLVPDTPLVTAGTTPLPAPVHPRPSVVQVATRAGLVVGVTATSWMGIDALGDLTQSRPDVLDPSASTVVELTINHRGGRPAQEIAPSLWGACQHTVPSEVAPVSFTYADASTARLALSPALGEHASRRFRGCLADSGIPQLLVSVDSFGEVTTGD